MKWFRELFTASTASIPREAETPDPIDWTSIEEQLVVLVDEHLRRFSAAHANESFYGFGFDCNAETAEVLLCANTREGLLASAREALAVYPQFNSGKSIEDIEKEAEWGFGDWKYQGFNLESESWEEGWSDVQLQVSNARNVLLNNRNYEQFEGLRTEFMRMARRALVRVASSETMSTLRKDQGFRVLCTDHDEGPDDGFHQLSEASGT